MEGGISRRIGGVEWGVDVVGCGCGRGRAVERKRGEWGGRWGEGEESFEEEGVGGAGGEHELEKGVLLVEGCLVGIEGRKRGERYSVSALLVFPWYTAREAGC